MDLGRKAPNFDACAARIILLESAMLSDLLLVLNPAHPDFGRIKIGQMQGLDVDACLRRTLVR